MKQLCVAVYALSGMFTVAQQTPAPIPKQKVSWVAVQAPEIKRLADALSGVWTTTEKFEADEFRGGATGSGVFSIRTGPGGNSLVIDYTSQSTMGSYSSTRIMYWDRKDGRYRAFYCDSLQPTGCGEAGSGKWEGNELVFESTSEGHGGPFQMRERFSELTPGGFTFSLEVVDQGKSARSLTIHASKLGEKL